MMEQAVDVVQEWDWDTLMAQALRYRRLARQVYDEKACAAARALAQEYEAKAAALVAHTAQGNDQLQ